MAPIFKVEEPLDLAKGIYLETVTHCCMPNRIPPVRPVLIVNQPQGVEARLFDEMIKKTIGKTFEVRFAEWASGYPKRFKWDLKTSTKLSGSPNSNADFKHEWFDCVAK
jgi:hypothetical protein